VMRTMNFRVCGTPSVADYRDTSPETGEGLPK